MIQDVKKIYLCRSDLTPITVLNGVKTETVEYSKHVKDFDELTFEVDEYININGEQVKSNGYDFLDVYMYLYLEDTGCFQMQHPSKNNDGFKESKTITAYSIEKEFMDKDFVGLKINTGEKDSLEQLAEGNLNELGYAKEFIKFYNPTKPDLSLLNIIIQKMPGWSIIDDDIDSYLWEKKLSFDEENINLYAFLTSVVAPKAECIFLFDTVHRRIKAVSKENLDYDSNVFIGFRNLAKTISITTDEDSVYTRFNCEGADGLTLNDWNYNDSRIFDLSYFLREPYMSDDLVEKVNVWIKWRDDNRENYAGIAKQIAELEQQIYDINYRVPNDGDSYKQWDDMNLEGLEESLKYYNTLLTSLQVSVDPDFMGKQDVSYSDYVPWKKEDGSVDHDRYLQLLYEQANGYGGYYTYLEILNYIIPNIEIAIFNYSVDTEDEKKDYIEDYETNWDLYGIKELEGKKKVYDEKLSVLKAYSKPWSELTEAEKGTYNNLEDQYNSAGHGEYIKIVGYIGDENTPGTLLYKLKELNEEVSSLQSQEDSLIENRNSMILNASMDNPDYGFTDDDKIIINTLFHDTDYQNENILTTSIDTTVTTIDKEKELYDDSVSKLSEVSQPQLTFSVEMDNLLRLKEFQEWKGDFDLLHFIRLGIRDDYSVKMRITGLSWNPCEVTQDLIVEFSNMITSRSGRSDLTNLLDTENNRASKNGISIGTGNSKSDKEYMTSLLQLMIDTNLFKNSVSGIAGNTVGQLDENVINGLINKYLSLNKLDADKIYVDEGNFNRVFSKYIDTDYIYSKINVAEKLISEGILTGSISAEDGHFTGYLTGAKIVGDIIDAGTILADKILIRGYDENGDLSKSLVYAINNSGNIEATGVEPEDIENYQLNGKIIVAKSITSERIDVTDLWVNGILTAINADIFDAKITNLHSISANIGSFIIEKNDLYMVENVLGSDKIGSIYLGEKGFSLENKFIYDIENKTLSIQGDTTFSGELKAATGTFSGELSAATGTFSGELKAATGEFTGKITATEGKIGPWNITETSIWKGSNTFATSGAGNIYLGDDGFSLGKQLTFDSDGKLIINGKIIANEGEIGKWTIDTYGISYGLGTGYSLDGSNYSIQILPATSNGTYTNSFISIKNKTSKLETLAISAEGEIKSSGSTATLSLPWTTLNINNPICKVYSGGICLSGTTGINNNLTTDIQAGCVSLSDNSSSISMSYNLSYLSNYTYEFTNNSCALFYPSAQSWLSGHQGSTCIRIFGNTGWHPWLYVMAKDGSWTQGAYNGSGDGHYRLTYKTQDSISGEENNTTQSWVFRTDGGFAARSFIENGTALSNKYLSLSGGTLTGKLTASAGISVSAGQAIGCNQIHAVGSSDIGLDIDNASTRRTVEPMKDDNCYLGRSDRRFKTICASNGTINTSDEMEKDIISGITEPYENMFLNLQPILYKWKNFGYEEVPHDRVHCGLGSRHTLSVAKENGLDSMTVAAICRDDLPEPTIDGRTERYGLNYSELHGLEIHMIQKNYMSIEEHEKQIAELKNVFSQRIDELENRIEQLVTSA